MVTDTAPTFDAGLSAIAVAIPPDASGVIEVDIPVSGALVTAVGFVPDGINPREVWLVDSSAPARIQLAGQDSLPAMVVVGDRVSFRITKLKWDDPFRVAIHQLEDLSVISSNNPIHVPTVHGDLLDESTHGNRVFRTWGRVSEYLGYCGAPKCFIIDSGGASQRLRTRYSGVSVDVCVDIVAPFSLHGFGLGNAGFDTHNFDWIRVY